MHEFVNRVNDVRYLNPPKQVLNIGYQKKIIETIFELIVISDFKNLFEQWTFMVISCTYVSLTATCRICYCLTTTTLIMFCSVDVTRVVTITKL